MKTSIYIMILLAVLVMVPIISDVVTAQSAGTDRQLCLQNCSWLRPWGRNYGGYANYYNCVAGCESQFWSDFDRNTERLERKLHEPD
ncbi:MAG: hypothetical protein ACLQPD_03510 [Desulfomonilaceae bacterium]